MKKLLFLFAICVLFLHTANAQERDKWLHSDTLISGVDSIYVDTLSSKYQFVVVTIQDTGTTYTDSLQVETLDMNYKVWSPVAVRNLIDFTDTEKLIPGAGSTRRYLVLDPNIWVIRIIRYNAQYVAGRTTYISIMAKNY